MHPPHTQQAHAGDASPVLEVVVNNAPGNLDQLRMVAKHLCQAVNLATTRLELVPPVTEHPLPAAWAACPNLKELSIYDTGYVVVDSLDGLPPGLTKLTLGKLRTHDGVLLDLAPLTVCTSLREVSLHECISLAPLAASRDTLREFSGVNVDGLSACTQLEVIYANPANLGSFEAFTRLRELHIRGARNVDDLAPLAHLEHLRVLCCSESGVRAVTPLATCTSLEVLDVSYTLVDDVAPLASCASLKDLDISSTPVTDVAPLAACTLLHKLHCSDMVEGVALAPIPSLRMLSCMGYCIIADGTEHLTAMTALEELYIGSNLDSAEHIEMCTNLTTLDIVGSDVDDLSPLEGCTRLRVLICHNCDKLVELASLPALEQMLCCSAVLEDLEPLGGCTALMELELFRCSVTDITPLSTLLHLTSLVLSGNEVVDLAPISGLSNLVILHLRGNRVSDLAPLSNLRSLTSLELYDNRVSDLAPLSNLRSLTKLQVHGNCDAAMMDVSPLSGITSLQKLLVSAGTDVSPLSGLTNLVVRAIGC